MRVAEAMTRDVQCVMPGDTIERAARLMADWNVGALPVCEDNEVIGMITDRDITIRVVSAGKSPDQCHVEEIMSEDVECCHENDDLEEVTHKMAERKVRRIPVLDENEKLCGIVSLGDLSEETDISSAAHALKEISHPSHPSSSSTH